jgi:hypothetical protein
MRATSKSTKQINNAGPMPLACGSGEPNSASGNDSIPREQWIAEAAYFRAERRGFAPGNEISDWLDAEADVERMLENHSAAANAQGQSRTET